jgi:hypothetical protein
MGEGGCTNLERMRGAAGVGVHNDVMTREGGWMEGE